MKLVAGALKDGASQNQLVQLYWIALYDYKPNWAFREHIHDFSQIIYVYEGSGTANLSGRSVSLSPGVILFMVPGIPHSLTADSDVAIRTIDVKFAITYSQFYTALNKIRKPIIDKNNCVLHILQKVHQEAIKTMPFHKELCNALMEEALVAILRESMDRGSPEIPDSGLPMENGLIQNAREYIHVNYVRPVNFREASHLLGVSQQYLARKFKIKLGMTPHEYLMNYRIEKAKDLLRYTQAPIKEISYNVGFKSIHHFTRIFGRMENMPPASWRRRQSGVGREGVTVTKGFVAVDVTIDNISNEPVDL